MWSPRGLLLLLPPESGHEAEVTDFLRGPSRWCRTNPTQRRGSPSRPRTGATGSSRATSSSLTVYDPLLGVATTDWVGAGTPIKRRGCGISHSRQHNVTSSPHPTHPPMPHEHHTKTVD
jgi:hypothetical protein